MVHVEIQDDLHRSLCRLKPKARAWWDSCYGKRKGKVSLEEVIRWLYYTHD